MNGFEEFQKAGQDGLNRAMESFGALSRGWQSIAGEAMGYSKSAMETSAQHVEKLLGAKSVEVALAAQTDYVRSAYEQAVSQATRLGELYAETVKDAAKPFEGIVPALKK